MNGFHRSLLIKQHAFLSILGCMTIWRSPQSVHAASSDEYRSAGDTAIITRMNEGTEDTEEPDHPLLSSKSLRVVNSFDAKKVRDPENWRWYCYTRSTPMAVRSKKGSHVSEPQVPPVDERLSETKVEVSRLGFRKEPKGDHVVLLFDMSSRTIFWKWIPSAPAKWFQKEDSVNLAEVCFGPDPIIETLWVRFNPDWEHSWMVQSRLVNEEMSGGDVFPLGTATEAIHRRQKDLLMAETARLEKTLEEKRKRLSQISAEKAKLADKLRKVDEDYIVLNCPFEAIIRRRSSDFDGLSEEQKRRKSSELEAEHNKLEKRIDRMGKDYMTVLDESKKIEEKVSESRKEQAGNHDSASIEATAREMSYSASIVLKRKGEESR